MDDDLTFGELSDRLRPDTLELAADTLSRGDPLVVLVVVAVKLGAGEVDTPPPPPPPPPPPAFFTVLLPLALLLPLLLLFVPLALVFPAVAAVAVVEAVVRAGDKEDDADVVEPVAPLLPVAAIDNTFFANAFASPASVKYMPWYNPLVESSNT
jgi:hypothetical protein